MCNAAKENKAKFRTAAKNITIEWIIANYRLNTFTILCIIQDKKCSIAAYVKGSCQVFAFFRSPTGTKNFWAGVSVTTQPWH